MKKKLIVIIACIAIIAAGIGLYFYANPDETTDSSISVSLTISADGKTETYEVKTDAETLGEMLVDEGYVKNDQESYGLYIKTVYGPFKEGRTTDESKQEWWCVRKDGEMLLTGADETFLSDSDNYELELMVGYDQF